MARKVHHSIYNRITKFDIINYIILSIAAFITFFPFYYMIIVSFANYEAVQSQALYWYPTVFDTSWYKMIFQNRFFWASIKTTVFVTVVTTILGVIICVAAAYPLSKTHLPGRRFMFNFIIFTMFFGGGMIPFYITCVQLGLRDSVWVMIWPSLVGAFDIVLIKNFFQDLPESIEESAKVDGANDLVILFKIVLPMSTPIIATIALFIAVGKWNDWYTAMLLIRDKMKYPLQLLLREMILDTTANLQGMAAQIASNEKPTYQLGLKMATVAVATIPIFCVYPFVQKYFTKGILLGGVKG